MPFTRSAQFFEMTFYRIDTELKENIGLDDASQIGRLVEYAEPCRLLVSELQDFPNTAAKQLETETLEEFQQLRKWDLKAESFTREYPFITLHKAPDLIRVTANAGWVNCEDRNRCGIEFVALRLAKINAYADRNIALEVNGLTLREIIEPVCVITPVSCYRPFQIVVLCRGRCFFTVHSSTPISAHFHKCADAPVISPRPPNSLLEVTAPANIQTHRV
jgi:hypothetical protein